MDVAERQRERLRAQEERDAEKLVLKAHNKAVAKRDAYPNLRRVMELEVAEYRKGA